MLRSHHEIIALFAIVNTVRRFGAEALEHKEDTIKYLRGAIDHTSERLRTLPDPSQQLNSWAIARVSYPIVALADHFAHKVMKASQASKKSVPPDTANPQSARVGAPPIKPPVTSVAPTPPPFNGPQSVLPPLGAVASAKVHAPASDTNQLVWQSDLELGVYGTNQAGLLLFKNSGAILGGKPPEIASGAVNPNLSTWRATDDLKPCERELEFFSYWIAIQAGFEGDQSAFQPGSLDRERMAKTLRDNARISLDPVDTSTPSEAGPAPFSTWRLAFFIVMPCLLAMGVAIALHLREVKHFNSLDDAIEREAQ